LGLTVLPKFATLSDSSDVSYLEHYLFF